METATKCLGEVGEKGYKIEEPSLTSHLMHQTEEPLVIQTATVRYNAHTEMVYNVGTKYVCLS